jgi:elongator complex protein 6
VFVDGLSEHSSSSQTNPLPAVQEVISKAIVILARAEQASPVLLVLDSPDLLLASGSATAQQLDLFILKLRSLVHAVILTFSADQPLLNPTRQASDVHASPLETEASRFLTQQAHNARLVISVRELATGAARDISGVLRVTRSACAYDDNGSREQGVVEEMEVLYLVQRDGSVKVFQRGTDSG